MSRPSLRALTITSSATRLATAPAWIPAGMADGAAAELQHDIITEQIEQLMHLAGMNAARRDRHDFAQVGPVLIEEQAARQVLLGVAVAADVVVALHRHGIALELAHRRAGVQMIDACEAQPLGDDSEADAVVLLARVGAMSGTMHVQDHVVLAAPVGHALDRRPADDQVDHHDDRAQLLGELRALVHVLHGPGGDVQIRALDLAGGRARLVDGIHDIEEAVAPVHEGLRVDVLVVLHEVEAALEPLVNHAAIVAAGQPQLGLGGGAQQRPAEFIQALALDDESGGRPLEGLDVGDGDANVLEPSRLERLEAEHIADEARRHVGDRAFLEQDDVVGHPGEVLAGVIGHGLDFVGLGAVAVAGGQPVGPHHRPGGGARFAGHRGGGLDGVDAVLGRDAEQAEGVGVLGDVVGVPVAHLPVLQHAGAVALLGVLDVAIGRVFRASVAILEPPWDSR